MTGLMEPDAARDPSEVVMRPAGATKGHARRRSAIIVAASLLAGLVAAIALVAGSTHQSLIDEKSDAAQASRAIGDVVRGVRTKRD